MTEIRIDDTRAPKLGAPTSIHAAQQPKRSVSAIRRYLGIWAFAMAAIIAAACVIGLGWEIGGTAARVYVPALLLILALAGCIFLLLRRRNAEAKTNRMSLQVAARLGSEGAESPMGQADQRASFDHTSVAMDRLTQSPNTRTSEQLAAGVEFASRSIDAQTDSLQAVIASAGVALSVQTQALVNRLSDEQSKVMEALELYGQSISSRLNVASVSLAREFRDSGEQLTRRVESAGDAAIDAIARRGEAVASALKAQMEQGEEARRGLSLSMDGEGRALGAAAAGAVQTLEDKLRDVTVSIDQLVESALERIESRIAGRIDELSSRLLQVDKGLDAEWTSRRSGLVAELMEAAKEARAAVSGAAGEVGRLTAESVESAKLAFGESLQDSLGGWRELAESTSQQLDAAADRASQALARNEVTLAERLDAFESGVVARTSALSESLASQTEALQTTLARAETLASRGAGDLLTTARAINEALDGRLEAANVRFGDWRKELEGALESHVRTLDQRREQDAAGFAALAERHRDAVLRPLGDYQAALARDFAAGSSDLHARLAEREQEMVVRIDALARDYVQRLSDDLQGATESLGTRAAAMRDQVWSRQNEVAEAIESSVARTESEFAKSLQAAGATLDALAARIGGGIEQRGQAISITLAHATETLLQSMSDAAREAQTTLGRSVTEVVGVFDAGRGALVGSVAEIAAESSATIISGVEEHRRALASQLAEATRLFDSGRANLTEAITRAAADAGRLLSDSRQETSQALTTGSVEASQIIEAGRNRLLASLAEAAQSADEALSKRGRETLVSLDEEASRAGQRLERSRAALAGAASASVDRFTEQFSQQMFELQAAFEGGAERMKREVANPLNDSLARIEREGAELATATRALAESFANTASIHRDQMHQTFAREADALATKVASNVEIFHREFKKTVVGADEVFLSRGQGFADTISAQVVEMRELLEREAPVLLASFDSINAQISRQVESASQRSLGDFERKANALISLLTRRGDDLLSAMAAASSESTRKVVHLTGELESGAERAEASLRQIERKVGAMLTIVDDRASELSSQERSLPPASAGH